MTADGASTSLLENRISPYANKANATRTANTEHPNIIFSSKCFCKPDMFTPYWHFYKSWRITFTLHVCDLIFSSGGGGDGAAEPVGAVWVSAFVRVTPLDIFKETSAQFPVVLEILILLTGGRNISYMIRVQAVQPELGLSYSSSFGKHRSTFLTFCRQQQQRQINLQYKELLVAALNATIYKRQAHLTAESYNRSPPSTPNGPIGSGTALKLKWLVIVMYGSPALFGQAQNQSEPWDTLTSPQSG